MAPKSQELIDYALTLPREELIELWTTLSRALVKSPPADDGNRSRPQGLARGLFQMRDDFFDPLPEEVLQGFEGR